ncbi:MAG: tRNA adenosine(34) deaminase TadA [Pyrinomonadaceae bacterium]
MIEGAEKDADAHWMRLALAAAREAEERGEVPIGAVLVADEKLLAVAGNRTRTDCDPTAHAEIIALREAAKAAGNYRLTDAVVYSTIEPCAMCAGALVQARVRRLVYGARDERAGAVDTHFRICASSSLNHQIIVTSGVLEEQCRIIMQDFFRARRNSKDEGGRMKDERETTQLE